MMIKQNVQYVREQKLRDSIWQADQFMPRFLLNPGVFKQANSSNSIQLEESDSFNSYKLKELDSLR